MLFSRIKFTKYNVIAQLSGKKIMKFRIFKNHSSSHIQIFKIFVISVIKTFEVLNDLKNNILKEKNTKIIVL